jgi:subtilisin family serine protease
VSATTPIRAVLLVLVAAALTVAAPGPVSAASVPGEVVVGLRDGAGASVRAAVARRGRVVLVRRLAPGGPWLARVRSGQTTDQAVARLDADPAVRWAEPNYVVRALLTPDDPLFGSQWGLLNTGQIVSLTTGTAGADIGVGAAWDRTTGSERVRVAVVDTGVDHTNPDLAPNIGVVNPGEAGDGRETNGIDDDRNLLVDDWRGWDFAEVVGGDDADPNDEHQDGHGTLVAGVIGARGGNGLGTAGVSWSSRIIPVRSLNDDGFGTTANIASGITYSASLGARILNASLGTFENSLAIRDAIARAPNMLVVTAAGNSGANNDAIGLHGPPMYPCNLTFDNVVCVAATDHNDGLATFSNFGVDSVDLAAPGLGIIGPGRRDPQGAYPPMVNRGTSFSAPHVSGVAALVLAENPTASTAQLRQALLAGVEPLPSLAGKVVTGGRLDALGALDNVPPAQPGPGGASGPVTEVTTSSARLTGSLPLSLQALAYYFEYGTTTEYGSFTATRPSPPGPAIEVSAPIDRLAAGTRYHARLVVAALDGITFGSDQTFTPGAAAAPPAGGGTAPGPAGATTSGGSTTPRPRAARPKARLLHLGDSWFATLRLAERSTVRGTLQRRVSIPRAGAHGEAAVRLRTVKRLDRRSYRPGVRRVSLGRLATGRYRLTLRIAGPSRATTLVRSLLVPPARRRPPDAAARRR